MTDQKAAYHPIVDEPFEAVFWQSGQEVERMMVPAVKNTPPPVLRRPVEAHWSVRPRTLDERTPERSGISIEQYECVKREYAYGHLTRAHYEFRRVER